MIVIVYVSVWRCLIGDSDEEYENHIGTDGNNYSSLILNSYIIAAHSLASKRLQQL